MKKKVVKRPWGSFERFCLNEKTTVKILEIKARGKLSLQYHSKRGEFWKILEGKAKIRIGDRVVKAKKGDEFLIPVKKKHRIEALNKVRVLEISFGKFVERDEVKLEDIYNRK